MAIEHSMLPSILLFLPHHSLSPAAVFNLWSMGHLCPRVAWMCSNTCADDSITLQC